MIVIPKTQRAKQYVNANNLHKDLAKGIRGYKSRAIKHEKLLEKASPLIEQRKQELKSMGIR